MVCDVPVAAPPTVDIARVDGQWQVTIVEGALTTVETFFVWAHAKSFANGQRVRLKLPCVFTSESDADA